MVIEYSDIENQLSQLSMKSSQAGTLFDWRGVRFYFKSPPSTLTPPLQRFRLINELIYSQAAVLIFTEIAKYFKINIQLPEYHVVVNGTEIVGIASKRISYDDNAEFNGYRDFKKCIESGFGFIAGVRERFCDPDGAENVSGSSLKDDTSKIMLSTIDFGLSNYPMLLQKNALTFASEDGRINSEYDLIPPVETDDVFGNSFSNLLFGFLRNDNEYWYNTLNCYPDFLGMMIKLAHSESSSLLTTLFRDYFFSKQILNQVVTGPGFKQIVIDCLGLNTLLSLNASIESDFDEIMNALISRECASVNMIKLASKVVRKETLFSSTFDSTVFIADEFKGQENLFINLLLNAFNKMGSKCVDDNENTANQSSPLAKRKVSPVKLAASCRKSISPLTSPEKRAILCGGLSDPSEVHRGTRLKF